MVSCSFIDWLFLSVRISFSNCGLNEFTRLNGQFSSGPSIRFLSVFSLPLFCSTLAGGENRSEC
ncbi:uncharacterized protein DS421_9g268480 [Arachis hypogaea]|nr:uncharacterized protein DS421_9g268480 [Arachis hypogaea]